MKKNTRRILAIAGIVLLLSMYLINLVLALIGSEAAREMLKVTMVMSIMIPILLYAILMLMRRNDAPGGEEELTPRQRDEIWQRMMEDAGPEALPGNEFPEEHPGTDGGKGNA